MKTALYIQDGREQIVLTPETELEKAVLGKIQDAGRVLTIKRGSFYDCQGGWTRMRSFDRFQDTQDISTILVLEQATPQQDQENNHG